MYVNYVLLLVYKESYLLEICNRDLTARGNNNMVDMMEEYFTNTRTHIQINKRNVLYTVYWPLLDVVNRRLYVWIKCIVQ